MNILFLSTKAPLPTNDGHSLRTYNLLKEIARVHNVHLLSFTKFEEEFDYIDNVKELCKSVSYFKLEENISQLSMMWTLAVSIMHRHPFVALKYYKKDMENMIRLILQRERIDIVHVDILPMCVYLSLFKTIPTILNAHNAESILFRKQVDNETHQIKKMYLESQIRKLDLFERKVVDQVDHILTCSQEDQKIFESFNCKTPIEIIPNGVDTNFFRSKSDSIEEDKKIVFVGGLNWFPNFDGLKWFDKEILPYVRQKYPDICVHVIGRYDKKNIVWENRENFYMEGFVQDIRPYLQMASVVVVPLRVGGGTRLKILDSMGMSKAIVSTSIGAEGLGAINGVNILLRDSAEDFAKGIIELIERKERRQLIKAAARAFVEQNYQWESIGYKLLNVYDTYKNKG